MTFVTGALVNTRGREWVVLPESKPPILVLRPLGGSDDEVTGIHTGLEKVESAQFQLPDPTDLGDYRSCRLLRDAVRIGFRSSAGPFRSFGRISVEPRPYQMVPLLMALKLDPVRILIADDVGIGKTIEACLIARELKDRGEVTGLAVLCPPHLAEQWQVELAEKFHIDTELVLTSTVKKLERKCRVGQSLFEVYPNVIVSTDFIKADKWRDEFVRSCPGLVIVDEAHTCAADVGGKGNHLRHQVVRELARNEERHMILVTATPHSGKEESFRSLLGLLDKAFVNLPPDLTGGQYENIRRHIASHFIQRRRGDILHYLGANTHFPERLEAEENYRLSGEYRKLFARVISYVQQSIRDGETSQHRQRVRWWSALALLRSIASSPAAASATLRSRASVADAQDAAECDDIGRELVLDLDLADSTEAMDIIPGSDPGEFAANEESTRKALLEMARAADQLQGDLDEKMLRTVKIVEKMLREGSNLILFCRFIPTAEYLRAELVQRLPRDIQKNLAIDAVTGLLPHAEREERIARLAESPRRILVATDCLSEGINLQEDFNAVLHYDLSWNPTRHEQREGRVDRYGQKSASIKVVTLYGLDNQIDGIVLDVLLRKHKTIRSSLGISVPIPSDTNAVVEAVFEGLLLRGTPQATERFEQLSLGLEHVAPIQKDLFLEWEKAGEREKLSRTLFAQRSIKPEEVANELTAAQEATGAGLDLPRFFLEAVHSFHGTVSGDKVKTVDWSETPQALLDVVEPVLPVKTKHSKVTFEQRLSDDVTQLTRSHPAMEALATFLLNATLDPHLPSRARRAGAMVTKAVPRRTTLLLVRMRYHIISRFIGRETALLAEDVKLVAFEGSPKNPQWLGSEAANRLLQLNPDDNVNPDMAAHFVRQTVESYDTWMAEVAEKAREHGETILEQHRRVRAAANKRGVTYRVEAQLPPDILGIYIFLPKES